MFDLRTAGQTLPLPRLLKPLQQAIQMMHPVIEQLPKKDDQGNSEGPLENCAADLKVGACCSGRGREKEVLNLPAQGRVNQDQNPKEQHRKRPKNVGQPRIADPPDETVDQELGEEEKEEF